jgi:hypothetical protein
MAVYVLVIFGEQLVIVTVLEVLIVNRQSGLSGQKQC